MKTTVKISAFIIGLMIGAATITCVHAQSTVTVYEKGGDISPKNPYEFDQPMDMYKVIMILVIHRRDGEWRAALQEHNISYEDISAIEKGLPKPWRNQTK